MKSFLTCSFAVLLAIVLAAAAGAQFNRDYSHDPKTLVDRFSTDVSVALADGTFVTVGTVFGEDGDRDAIITRVRDNGDVIWSRTYGDPKIDEVALGLCLSHDGEDVLVTGTTLGDLWILRVATLNGDVVWSQRYGTEPYFEVGHVILAFEDSVGADYFAVGMVYDDPRRVVYLVRVDDSGAPVYKLRYDTADDAFDQPTGVLPRVGEIWITGLRTQTGYPPSLFVLPVRTSMGLNQPMAFYPHPDGSVADRLPALAPASDQGALAAYTAQVGGAYRIAALRLDRSMNPLWEQHYWGTGPELPPGPFQEASWGIGVEPFSDGFVIGTAHTDRSIAGLLTIDVSGIPFWLYHYKDYGFTDSSVGPGDSVARLASDGQGYLLKNQLVRGFSLTWTDPFGLGHAPCDVEPEVKDTSAKIKRINISYQPTSWGFDDPHPIDPEDLEVGESECP